MENDQTLLERAVSLHRAGMLADAEAIYRDLLRRHPQHAQILHFLGILASEIKKPDQAIEMIQEAIRIEPQRAEFYSNLSSILHEQLRVDEALNAARQAIRLEPDFAEAYNNAGNALHQLGDFATAIEAYRRAITINPDYAMFYFNLGNTLRSTGDLSGAIANFEQFLGRRSDFPEAYNNLGIALMELGAFERSVQSFYRAIQLRPSYAEAYENLGKAWVELGMYAEAIQAFEQTNSIKPQSADIALIYAKQHACDWNGLDDLSQKVVAQVASQDFDQSKISVPPFAFLTLPIETSAALQQRCARTWTRRKFEKIRPFSDHSSVRLHSRNKIRVGYLSADFYAHATSYLVAELFKHHCRDRFEIFGYSIGKTDQSSVAQRIQSGCDAFVDLTNLSHRAAAQRIQEDEIQILVDLKGYTRGCRPEIMAQRPAPIQVNYLGFPGTMGADFIDYILVDDWIVPAADQRYFTEQRVALPFCYQPNDGQMEIASDRPTRSQYHLPENAFVFGSWCNPYKITPTLFEVWARLLREIPESVLWLIDTNPTATKNLQREASIRGVDADRLIFSKPQPSPIHLARQVLADLVLDTYPVCAHTTASDALRLGVPMVTLSSATFVSRVASSLLQELGFQELIATNLKEYEEIVFTLVTQRWKLQSLRERLGRQVRSHDIFSSHRIVRHLEFAFERMWSSHLRQEKVQPIFSHEFPA